MTVPRAMVHLICLAQALFFARRGDSGDDGEPIQVPRPSPDADDLDLWADPPRLCALRADYEARWSHPPP